MKSVISALLAGIEGTNSVNNFDRNVQPHMRNPILIHKEEYFGVVDF